MKARTIALAVIALLPGASRPADAPHRTAAAPIDPRLPEAPARLAGLLTALRSVEQRPTLLALAQPGAIDDLIHIRAALAGMSPERRVSLASVTAIRRASVYHAPVAGRLVIGFGEISEAGIRSRGLTFAVQPGDPVLAPAGGIVRYAQVFRGYGGTVIVDHGRGWTSLLTGLGTLAVAPGSGVRGGMPLGTTGKGTAPRITLELRRRGQPVDVAAMIG